MLFETGIMITLMAKNQEYPLRKLTIDGSFNLECLSPAMLRFRDPCNAPDSLVIKNSSFN
jgi:hypothetical protein